MLMNSRVLAGAAAPWVHGIAASDARIKAMVSKIRRWRPGEDKNRRALAELGDEELSNLSELGLKVRREARRWTAAREIGGRKGEWSALSRSSQETFDDRPTHRPA